ncbi:cyclodeaminase/cyclohydrolase family protein [Subtercola endophyticus]|uniref:cyclodeaminase/cyclohydrolase family protein n=1 Tax=Subtercola endophyticus TaxID=2895559 RepID=UPI001E2B1B7E|nr:cyclodeaminase/cyclohydrolase family protein [Subtercola endophyticus]UFS60926.1 cyclodeaminase/cyclohydrolase family protein [Subtercola endophyticus]
MAKSEYAGTQRASVGEWMHGLGETRGDPGGGAAAGVMLAITAALTAMIAGYTHADTGSALADERDAVLERAHELRVAALRLADDDAVASREFGGAFRLPKGDERDRAIRHGSVDGARSSAALGERAIGAVDDLQWLAQNGNPALIADLAVACGALRAALTAARTNLSFDLAALTASGESLEQVRLEHPVLWGTVPRFDDAIARIDGITAAIDARAAPTD